MNKYVGVLLVQLKGRMIVRQDESHGTRLFSGVTLSGETAARAASRVLAEYMGLSAQPDDFEFLDTYQLAGADDEVAQMHAFVVAGVDEDRIYPYEGEESLLKIQRNDDFSSYNLSAMDRKIVIDYFKRHK